MKLLPWKLYWITIFTLDGRQHRAPAVGSDNDNALWMRDEEAQFVTGETLAWNSGTGEDDTTTELGVLLAALHGMTCVTIDESLVVEERELDDTKYIAWTVDGPLDGSETVLIENRAGGSVITISPGEDVDIWPTLGAALAVLAKGNDQEDLVDTTRRDGGFETIREFCAPKLTNEEAVSGQAAAIKRILADLDEAEFCQGQTDPIKGPGSNEWAIICQIIREADKAIRMACDSPGELERYISSPEVVTEVLWGKHE